MEFEDRYIYKSTDIALYLVQIANKEKITINMTKLQKLLYIVYGVYLRVYRSRLLDEHPQAWPYGPVFPTTRNKLLKEGFSSIAIDSISEEVFNDEKLNKVVKFVFKHFGTWYAGQLSEWSHIDGSPWHKTTQQANFKWGDVIDDQLIAEYFSSIITINNPKDESE